MLALLSKVRNIATLAVADECANVKCATQGWRRWAKHGDGLYLNGQWCCSEDCFISVLSSRVRRLGSPPPAIAPRVHRLPLGLLMLSQHWIDESQLQAALEMQKADPGLKIGSCLESLGWVRPQDVTRALAAQHSLPLLHPAGRPVDSRIPLTLLRAANCIAYAGNYDHSLLYLGFDAAADQSVLAAAEYILQSRCQPCIVSSESIREQLELRALTVDECEIAFQTATSVPELVRIVCSYAKQVGAERVRVAETGKHLWVNIAGARSFDLTFVLS